MRAGTMTARVFPCFLASKLRRVSHWPLQRRRGIHWPMELGAADRGRCRNYHNPGRHLLHGLAGH